MSLHYEDGGLRLFHGSNRDILPTFPDASYDSIVTDPPYELGFMGKGWDSSGIAYDVDVWRECFRVLKPGGYLLSFGGSRTWHRIATAIEDAGFEIRDSIAWMYGSGFPKSMDVSKAIDKAAGATREVIGRGENFGASKASDGKKVFGDYAGSWDVTAPATEASREWAGWGTALKPAFEPIIVARKPLAGTVAANVLAYGTGAINIDGARVQTAEALQGSSVPNDIRGGAYGSGNHPNREELADYEQHPAGRFPPNVLLDETQAAELDRQAPDTGAQRPVRGTEQSAAVDGGGIYSRRERVQGPFYGDRGGASRFFPTFRYEAKAPGSERPSVDGVAHATVKPLDLMRWLVRLVTRPGGRVLDLFAGSGTTGEAALLEGMEVDLIELETDHLPLILARIRKPLQPSMFGDWEAAS